MGGMGDAWIMSHQDALDKPATVAAPQTSDNSGSFAGFRKPTLDIAKFPADVGDGGGFEIHDDVVSGVVGAMGQDNDTLNVGQNALNAAWALAGAGGAAWDTIANFTVNAFNAGNAVSTYMQQLAETYEQMTSALHSNVQGYADADSDSAAAAKRATA
jgi:hypothetical protein